MASPVFVPFSGARGPKILEILIIITCFSRKGILRKYTTTRIYEKYTICSIWRGKEEQVIKIVVPKSKTLEYISLARVTSNVIVKKKIPKRLYRSRILPKSLLRFYLLARDGHQGTVIRLRFREVLNAISESTKSN